MGAPAISTAPRRAPAKRGTRRAAKPAKPRAGAAAKPRPKARAAARPKARAAARPRARTAAARPKARAGAGGVVMLPVAAVGGIADSGLVSRMTRGRLWIGLLAVLLGGIVALNVWGLGMSATSSSTEARIDSLQQENGVLRARRAEALSTEEIQRRAAALGLEIPAPDAIHYLDAHDSDAARAAKRLAAGELVVGDPAVQGEGADEIVADPAATADPAAATVPTDPAAAGVAATEPIIDPNTGLPAVDPATGAPITAVDPVTGAAIP